MSEHIRPLATTARRAPTYLPVLRISSAEHHAAPPSAVGADRFVEKSCNEKLAPVTHPPGGSRPGLRAIRPFVSITDASIAATCPDTCGFKAGGCYAKAGFTGFTARKLDEAARGLTGDEVIAEEAHLIDGAFRGGRIPQDGAKGGRDLRLHVGGDVGSDRGARLLAGAAGRWRDRGGGAVWTFTHAWREVPHEAWGSISVLASVERQEDIQTARAAGYAAAIVVDKFPSDKAFSLPGSTTKIVPCPAETRGKTCVECRLCLDADKLLRRNVAIAFQAHGPTARRAREALTLSATEREAMSSNGSVVVREVEFSAKSRRAA
jgi:hypothetical protein